ncbi:hypothetical protein PIB30_044730 [Stylosanthes scabra]|uniref:Myb/SANT-like domain-containing protein n=1 Tax=Stylosanthes scabra TaxID=79078 RepID=A0ABU6XHB7_9FABA|nr:hypothetical protein [Stylosanthes scabra]
MKEKHQYAAEMLACSGFGWNAEKQCIDVDSREVLETWIKRKILSSIGRNFRLITPFFISGSSEEILHTRQAISNVRKAWLDLRQGLSNSRYSGNPGQGTASSVDRIASTRKLSGKKRKQTDILERIADEIHESTAAQREHVQILANAISGKNDEVKMGEKLLKELRFADHDAIQVVVKICSDPRLEKSLWGLTDAQKTTIAQDVLDGKY